MRSKEYMITVAMLLLVTYTLSLSLVSQAFPAGQTSRTLSSTGSIQIQTTAGIGVYENVQCTTPKTSMLWGTLEPGTSQTITCYIKNEGSTSTIISKYVDAWVPESLATSNYLVLSWNYNEQPINPGASIPVTFTLLADAGITGITTFSFDITIVGSS